MKLRNTLLTTIILLASQSTAYAFCKLNIRGDSICVGTKALHQEDLYADESDASQYKPVVITNMQFPKVDIKEGKELKTVSIDSLVGSQEECTSGDQICEKDKVELIPGCADTKKKNFRVKKVYNNEFVEVKSTGFFLFHRPETIVVPAECIDSVK